VPIVGSPQNVKHGLDAKRRGRQGFRMTEEKGNKMSREKRLAAKLRENLRRRKAQTREMRAESGANGVPKENPES
jgi:hypothetical protein